MHLWKVQNKEEKKGFWLNVLGNCPNEAAKNPARHVPLYATQPRVVCFLLNIFGSTIKQLQSCRPTPGVAENYGC